MAIIIDGIKHRNLQEQVEYLTEKAGELSNKVDLIEQSITDYPTVKSDLETIKNEITMIKGDVDSIIEDIDVLTLAVEQTYEKDFVTVTITPEQFDNSTKSVTLTNEAYKLTNVITIAPTPDNGTTILNNAFNIAYSQIVPVEQTIDGELTLKCENLPTGNIYLNIQVESQIDLQRGV